MIDQQRVDRAIWRALKAAPYAAQAMAAARMVITDKMPEVTTACDSRWRVYIHPELTWSDEELAWGLLHEVMGHLVRGHHKQSEGCEPMLANVAQDCEIESWDWPKDKGVSRPPKGVRASTFKLPEGKLWRWYYDQIPQCKNVKCSHKDCGSGSGGAPRPYELPGSDPDHPALSKPLQEAIRRQVAEEIQAHAKKAGNMPAGLEVWANSVLDPPKVNWRRILRSAIARLLTGGASKQLGPSKVRHGVMVPRWRSPIKRIGVVADTSGSMNALGGKVLGAVIEIAKAAGSGVDVCWVDTKPTWQNGVKSIQQLKPKGGRGTDLRPAIEEARARRYDATIIITDCECEWLPAPSRGEVVLALEGHPPAGWKCVQVSE